MGLFTCLNLNMQHSWIKTFLFLPSDSFPTILATFFSINCGFTPLQCNIMQNLQFPVCDMLVLPKVTDDILP